jgi:D-arabinose 1-dehydrogenase-like Zn-dependent alcohol dehydrogenase
MLTEKDEAMKVFVTGATGFIGFAIVKELLAAGHEVTGLARSEASGKKLLAAGARVHLGSVEDFDGLGRAAAAADGAVHTALYHKVTHMPGGMRLRVILGGVPGGIVMRFLTQAVATDRRVLQTIGRSFAGTDRPLEHFHFWCVQGDRPRRGFSSRKDALRYTCLCRVEVKML